MLAATKPALAASNAVHRRFIPVAFPPANLVDTRFYLRSVRLSNGRKRMAAAERREVIELAATELFAERGYHGASMDEIARRSGVSPPVVYDHFASKQDLHRRLLERHYADLREVWRQHLPGDEPAERRIARAIDARFAYVGTHPYAGRMLFRETTRDPAAQ